MVIVWYLCPCLLWFAVVSYGALWHMCYGVLFELVCVIRRVILYSVCVCAFVCVVSCVSLCIHVCYIVSCVCVVSCVRLYVSCIVLPVLARVYVHGLCCTVCFSLYSCICDVLHICVFMLKSCVV